MCHPTIEPRPWMLQKRCPETGLDSEVDDKGLVLHFETNEVGAIIGLSRLQAVNFTESKECA